MSTIGEIGQTLKNQPRKSYLKSLIAVALMLTSLLLPSFFAANVRGVHTLGLFELDGNIADGGAAGPDWGSIFDSSGNVANLFGGVAATFLHDQITTAGAKDNTTYSGAGGSNKNNDIIFLAGGDTWHWDTGDTPPKDDFLRGYAYAVLGPGDHLIVYSGFERRVNTGDSHIDIELLQDDVALQESNGTKCVPSGIDDHQPCHWSGTRTADDVIISMDFSQGGGIGTITVRRFDPSLGTNGEYGPPIETLTSPTVANPCTPSDLICGINNPSPITSIPWAPSSTLDVNQFTEFGIDVTALLQGTTPCISTILGKTRSSTSFTAELKDFAGPFPFPVCSANISIAPDDVNEVGVPHTFTVTVNKVVAGAETPVAGVIVAFELMDANGAISMVISETCSTGTDVNGQCTITFKSNTAGTVTGRAEASVPVNGLTFDVATDGTGGTGNAVKRYVDAFIAIEPDDVNSIGDTHTFKVTVQKAEGNLPAPPGDPVFVDANGVIVDVDLTDSGGAGNIVLSDDCVTGTVNGMCFVSFTSNTPGTVTGHASANITINGVTVHRETDGTGKNSDDAVKVFVAGSLFWTKVDNDGNLLGGATFRVTRTHSFDPQVDTADVFFDVTDNIGLDEDPTPGEFLVSGLVLGRYEVKETVPPPGFEADPDTEVAVLTIASPDATIPVAFSNPRPILKVTGFGYENTLTSTPSQCPPTCTVSGTATYNVTIHNFGNAAAVLSGSLHVTIAGAGSGTLTCTGGCTLALSGTIAAGGSATFTLDIQYTDVDDGAVITALLTATYTTTVPGDLTVRTVNGTPATISFTAQAD